MTNNLNIRGKKKTKKVISNVFFFFFCRILHKLMSITVHWLSPLTLMSKFKLIKTRKGNGKRKGKVRFSYISKYVEQTS